MKGKKCSPGSPMSAASNAYAKGGMVKKGDGGEGGEGDGGEGKDCMMRGGRAKKNLGRHFMKAKSGEC